MTIQMVDLKRQYEELKAEIDAAVLAVMASSQFIYGPQVQALAEEVAHFQGGGHVIPCNSGTDALQLALKAIDLQPGDEVITTPFTFYATAEAIVLEGGVPVFVDIEERYFTIDVQQIEAAITPRTRAIIPVHLYGQPADLDPILDIARRHQLVVIEDAAQALGAFYKGQRVGTIGEIGCVSLYPGKNLGAFGDGGLVLTRDENLAKKIEMLANHGASLTSRYQHEYIGMNSRLDALQAAIVRIKLPHLDRWNRRRQEIAAIYSWELASVVQVPEAVPYGTHIYHQYVIRTPRRDELQQFLREKGIPTAVHYPIPIHLQPAFQQRFAFKAGQFPVSEAVAQDVLSLPIHPHLTDTEVQFIVESVHQFFEQNS